MYILVIGRGYMPADSPMLGIFEFDQAKALHKAGHKVIYISLDLRSFRHVRNFGKSHFIKEGIEVYDISIPLGRVPFFLLYHLGRIGLLSIYKDIVKKHGIPDIVHAHFMEIAAISLVLKEKYKLPFVMTEHSSIINQEFLDKKIIKIGNTVYKYADKVISVSSVLSERIKHHFNIDSIVIHNMVDFNLFTNSAENSNNNPNNFIFLSVGNLIPRKGFKILLESFAAAHFDTSVKLLIIGDGEEKTILDEHIKYLNLQNNVILLGFKPRNEIIYYVQKSNAFVLASKRETFGVVYIEALAYGLPVIATACGGPEDFVEQNNGILVPVNDTEALKNALLYMRSNAHLYNSDSIIKKCKERFASEIIVSKMIKIYSETQC
jgi:glycosyltransferase involved in cell wall biosynthesis